MHKGLLQLAALLGAFSVILGAFGAHALKKMATPEAVNIFETGVRYQFYHVFAIALASILFRDFNHKWMLWSAIFFVAGILLFSGSLYLLTWFKATGKTNLFWVGAITPLGGLAFIGGWLCMFIGLTRAS